MASKPPSRLRYEANNPVVSLRVSLKELETLRSLSRKTGLSLSQILKNGLGTLETSIDAAYNRGLRDGYGRFDAPCKYCGKPMKFDAKTEEDARKTLEKRSPTGLTPIAGHRRTRAELTYLVERQLIRMPAAG